MDSKQKNDILDVLYFRNQEDNNNNDANNKEEFNYDNFLEQLDKKYSKIVKDISMNVDRTSVSHGIWRPELNLVEIVREKNTKPYLPFKINNCKCLNNFEALFLIECRSLILFYKELLLSIEDAYELLLKNRRDLQLYKIFSTLSRIGYYVRTLEDPKNSNDNDCSPSHGTKRTLDVSDPEIITDSNRQAISRPEEFTLKQENYCVLNNIRQLQLNDIPKINKIDKELIKHFQKDQNSNNNQTVSNLFCVKKSSRPIELNKLVKCLYDGIQTKPVIPLGSIFNTDNLFQTIQTQSPKPIDSSISSDNQYETNLNIDFFVYRSRKQMQESSIPLFSVIVVNEDQPLPSIEVLNKLIESNKSPLYFALMSNSFNYNFYSFENLKFNKNTYPRLWETKKQ